MNKTTEQTVDKQPVYTGAQLAAHTKGTRRDVYAVVLDPGKEYTEQKASELAEQFLKREVESDGGR